MRWMQEASCRGQSTSLFFSNEDEKPADRKIREAKAKAICATCPVIPQCLQAGEGEEGIWGGMTEAERSGKRRKSPLSRPIVEQYANESNPWVVIEASGNAAIWQRESTESWHGVEWAVILRQEIIYTSFNLDATYAKYGSVIFS